MTRPNKDLRRLGHRRAQAQTAKVGAEIAMARARHGWSWSDVGRRAHVAPATVRRIELGEPGAQVDTLCAVGEAVGLDIVLAAYAGRSPGLRDRGQLKVAEHLCHLAHQRWQPRIEMLAGDHGEAIDLVLMGATELLAMEIDRLLLDFQERYRRNDLKRQWLAARHRRPVRLVMVIEDTARNRAAVAPHRDFIRSVLPAGSREVLAALRSGEPLGRDGLLWIRRRALPRKTDVRLASSTERGAAVRR